jgi:hypothetical protein
LDGRGFCSIAAPCRWPHSSPSERDVVEALVEAVLASEQARTSTAQVWSVRGTPPSLAEALTASGLRVEPYLYLTADLTAARDSEPDLGFRRVASRSRHPRVARSDEIAAARLLADAYRSADHVRAFAPDGSDESWLAYLRTLVATDGCGTLLPSATLVAEHDGLAAAVVTTTIDSERGVAHLAQLAVNPRTQGPGPRAHARRPRDDGQRLRGPGIDDAAGQLAQLPSGTALYDKHGFKQTGTFTIAAGFF